MEKNAVIDLLFRAVDYFNEQQSQRTIPKDLTRALFGRGGVLDSLGLVNFIVAIEQQIEDEVGTSISLTDERAMSQRQSPFRDIGTLAEFIHGILEPPTNV
jgi:D-alanine--poly(phosphoribitol) ligase subunit 2